MRLLILLSLSALAGCVGVNRGHPRTRGARNIELTAPNQPFGAVLGPKWRQIFLGAPPKPVLIGYIRTVDSEPEFGMHWVYDDHFTLVGRVSPKGQTVRSHGGTREVGHGNFNLSFALLRLFDRKITEEISLARMPPPRG